MESWLRTQELLGDKSDAIARDGAFCASRSMSATSSPGVSAPTTPVKRDNLRLTTPSPTRALLYNSPSQNLYSSPVTATAYLSPARSLTEYVSRTSPCCHSCHHHCSPVRLRVSACLHLRRTRARPDVHSRAALHPCAGR